MNSVFSNMISKRSIGLVICLAACLSLCARCNRVRILRPISPPNQLRPDAVHNTAGAGSSLIQDRRENDPHASFDPSHLAQERENNRRQSNDLNPANIGTGPAEETALSDYVAVAATRQENVTEPQQLQGDEPSACGRHKACSNREESRSLRIEIVKNTILEILKLEAPPNVTGHMLQRDSPPVQALLRRYGIDQQKQARMEDELHGEFRNEQLISTPTEPTFSYNGTRTENTFYFEFSYEELRFDVKSADIWFYVRPTNATNPNALIQLDLYQPSRQRVIPRLEPRMISRKFLNLVNATRTGFWRKISITQHVKDWFRRPARNFGIKLFTKRVLNLIATGTRPGEIEYKPFLYAELTSGRRRRKRGARQCDQDSTETRCCLSNFQVDFLSIGWDWILYPPRYDATYCAGECTMMELGTMRNKLVRHVALGSANQTASCCVPTQLAPLSMLFYDSSANIVYRQVPDMVIRRCGCM